MIQPGQLAERRKHLAEKIARERVDLAVAYRGLIKPFQIADKGITGLNFLRKNGWLLTLAPSLMGVVYGFLGYQKKPKPSLLRKLRGKVLRSPEAEEETASVLKTDLLKKAKAPLSMWGKRAWKLFQVYRKVRPFFP